MICQRCGTCCTQMPVSIWHNGRVLHKPDGVICPHLSFEAIKAKCAIHEESFFKNSACHIYGNSEIDPDFLNRKGKPCRIGESIQAKGGLLTVHPEAKRITFEELEDLGTWEEL